MCYSIYPTLVSPADRILNLPPLLILPGNTILCISAEHLTTAAEYTFLSVADVLILWDDGLSWTRYWYQ